MTIIYTHSSIHDDLESMVNAEISTCVERLSNFRSEREFTEMVRTFWLNENGNRMDSLLILQCSPQVDGPRMSSARYLIHDCKQETMKTLGKQTMAKHVCIIVHVDRRETKFSESSWQYSSLKSWDQVTIDSLLPPTYCFKTLVGKTVLQLIAEDVVDFEKIAEEELMWALSCINYIQPQNIESVSDVKSKILKSNILTLLKTNLAMNKDSQHFPALKEPHERHDWLSTVASDINLLSIHGTFDATIRETVRKQIQRILAKFLFFIEINSAWIKTDNADTIAFWEFCIQSSNILDICSSSIPEPMGPASFVISNKPLTLQFPFFMVFHEKIETGIKQNQNVVRMISNPDTDVQNTLLPTLEHTVRQAVNEDEFHEYLSRHVDTYLIDLFTVFSSNLHGSLPNENVQLLQTFLKNTFKPITDKHEESISKVAIVYFHMLTTKDILLVKLQLISTYMELSNAGESLRQKADTMDKIVQNVCECTLPTRSVLTAVGGAHAWQEKATSVILCAARVAEDPPCVFHFLKLCRNFCTLLQHLKGNELRLANLADLGKNLKDTIATPEVVNFIHSEIKNFREHTHKDLSRQKTGQMIEDLAGTFYIRAFEANPDDCSFTTALEQMYDKENLAAFARPLLFRIIERDIEDGTKENASLFVTGCEIIECANCIDQDEFPNLFALEKYLRQQQEIDNPLAVLSCDLIQKIVFGRLDLDDEELFGLAQKSVCVAAKSDKCTMPLIFSIALLSSVFKTLINVPKDDLEKKWCHIFSTSLEEDELQGKRVNSLKVYMVKHLREKYSMYELVDICSELKVLQRTSQLWPTHMNCNPMSYVEFYKEVKEKFEDKKTQSEILSKANYQTKKALALSAVIVERFVLGRRGCTDHLESTEKQLMASIAKKVKANLSGEDKKEFSRFIEHILNETILSEFIAFSEKRKNDMKNSLQQISVIAHISSIVLLKCNTDSFYQYLYPERSMAFPAGGTPVPRLNIDNFTGSLMVICPSCNEISQSTPSEDRKQLVCQTCQASSKHMSIKFINTSGRSPDNLASAYHRRSEKDLLRPDLSIRDLHPIAYRVLSVFTHGIFLIGHYINPEENAHNEPRINEELLKLFHLYDKKSADSGASIKIRTFLCEQIDQDWNVLETLLQRNTENTTIFLHSVIKESSDILTESITFPSFEKEFSKRVMDIYNKSEYLQNFKIQTYRSMGINDTHLEYEIDELCEKSSLELPRFFRYERDQGFISFKMDVLNSINFPDERGGKHVFLRLVISMKDQLECLCDMKPIVDWYRIVFNNLSHRITRQDAQKKIKEFEELGSASSEHFKDFKDSWNAIEKSWETITGNKPTFGQMSDERELAVCLDQSGHLKNIIDVLAEIQNQFLLKAHYITTSGRCPALKMQMDADGVATLETTPLLESKKDIIMFKWDDRLLINSYIGTKMGENIKHNCASIERQLWTQLVLNKKLLTTKHPFFNFVFIDELLAEITKLLQDIDLSIPQDKISKQVQEDIYRCYPPGDEKSKKVLEQIEIVLSFLQRSGGESKRQIHKYTSDLQFNSATKDLSSEPFTTLQLCHVVHLYELFEDIMATKSLLKLSSGVCNTLNLKALTRFESSLKQLDMENIVSLSSVVRKFSYRYLQSNLVTVDTITSPLADVMTRMTVTSEFAEVIRCIPHEVQLQHARAAIDIIEMQLENLRQSSNPTQDQSPTVDGPKSQSRRKRKKVAHNLGIDVL